MEKDNRSGDRRNAMGRRRGDRRKMVLIVENDKRKGNRRGGSRRDPANDKRAN